MAADSSKVKLGPAKVTFDVDGTPVEFEATQGGVVLNYTITTREVNIDQYGTTPIKEIITGHQASIEVPFAEYDLAKLNAIIPGAVLVGSGSSRRVDIDASAVTDLLDRAKKVIITPLFSDDPEDIVTLYKAAPVPQLNYTYSYENEWITNVTFKAYPDADGNLIAFGDPDATDDEEEG